MKIPSKYAPSHFISPISWLRRGIFSVWNSIPNAFVKPYNTDTRLVFVCGCGHSGTTLLASRLGQHDDAMLIGRETGVSLPPMSAYCMKRVFREWDHFAQTLGKGTIVEKTPKHIHTIDRIHRLLPQAKFIVVVRNPLDTISSLYIRFGNLDAAIRRWLVDNEKALNSKNMPFVKLVKYEDLTTSPENTLQEICGFLDIEWSDNLVDSGRTRYDEIVQSGNMALRARQVSKPIKLITGKWKKTFSDVQVSEVERRTAGVAKMLGYEIRYDRRSTN